MDIPKIVDIGLGNFWMRCVKFFLCRKDRSVVFAVHEGWDTRGKTVVEVTVGNHKDFMSVLLELGGHLPDPQHHVVVSVNKEDF